MLDVPLLRQVTLTSVQPLSLTTVTDDCTGALMSRDTDSAEQSSTTSSIEAIVSQAIQRELVRDRATRRRSERRRAAAERARHFDKLALAAASVGSRG